MFLVVHSQRANNHNLTIQSSIGQLDNFRIPMPAGRGPGPHSLTYPAPGVCNHPMGLCYDDKNTIINNMCDNMFF